MMNTNFTFRCGRSHQTDFSFFAEILLSIRAMNVSPLIMGTDIRIMTPSSLSIYSNPAVIALNQDPAVSAGIRVWRYYVPDVDFYGQGEISLWTRVLDNGDVVVAMINGGNNAREMNASLSDIWLDYGADRSRQAMTGYDVYDLWANRMDNGTAIGILNGTNVEVTGSERSRYNATAMGYEEGLNQNATALFGEKIMTLEPAGVLKAIVPRHGIGLYRLRANGVTVRKRDEL